MISLIALKTKIYINSQMTIIIFLGWKNSKDLVVKKLYVYSKDLGVDLYVRNTF